MKRSIFMFCLSAFLMASCTKTSTNNTQTDSNKESSVETDTTKANNAAEIYAKPQVPVLCYHRIEDGRNDEYTVSPAAFEAQMKILADSGYHSILPEQLYDYLVYNAELPDKPFLITYDDSRVEHHDIAASVMEKYGFHGTFFIMTITYNKKNYMTKDQIADLAKRGHTVGLHTWDHNMVTKYKTPEDWEKEIAQPKKELEQIVGKKVAYFAYPYGISNHDAAVQLNKYFKISFILSTKRDEAEPLQTVRRMIIPSGWSPETMLKVMRKTFSNGR